MDSKLTNADLELLAALIDGRLSGEERARAVKLVAESDEALEIFTSSLADERIAAAADAKVVPISTARRWRQWKVLVPAAAAAVLAFLVPTLGRLGGNAGLATQFAAELTREPRFVAGLPAGWDQRGWTVTRGGRPGAFRPGSAIESKLAFRLGVRSVDLQIAIRRGDTALAAPLTSEVVETLNGIQSAEPVTACYTDLKSRVATDAVDRSIERASNCEGELRDLLDSPSFVFGQWVGAADLAAQARDASFFESDHGTRFIRSTMPEGSLSTDDTDALGFIDARMNQGLDDRELEEVHARLQTVIRRRGS